MELSSIRARALFLNIQLYLMCSCAQLVSGGKGGEGYLISKLSTARLTKRFVRRGA
jgi:hypothetical protein